MPDPDQIPYVRQVKQLTSMNDVGDIPVIGELYGAGNTVIDYFESDCHPDWYVYAETLFPAAKNAVLVLLSFGLDDVLRGYLRPGGGRGFGGLGRASRRPRRSTRGTRARGLLRKGIPEIGEILGKHLPGAQVIQARQTSRAERFLWKVDGLGQRALFYWMIAGITEDFVVDWTTGLYQSEGCRGLEVGGMDRSDTNTGALGIGYVQLAITEEVENWGPVTSTGTRVDCPSGYQCDFLYTVAGSGGPPSWRATVQDLGAVFRTYEGKPAELNPETGEWESSVMFRTANGASLQWGLTLDTFGAVDVHAAHATLIARGGGV